MHKFLFFWGNISLIPSCLASVSAGRQTLHWMLFLTRDVETADYDARSSSVEAWLTTAFADHVRNLHTKDVGSMRYGKTRK